MMKDDEHGLPQVQPGETTPDGVTWQNNITWTGDGCKNHQTVDDFYARLSDFFQHSLAAIYILQSYNEQSTTGDSRSPGKTTRHCIKSFLNNL